MQDVEWNTWAGSSGYINKIRNNMKHEEAVAAVKQYGGIRQAARALKMSDNTIRKAYLNPDANDGKVKVLISGTPVQPSKSRNVISEKELLVEFDAETKATMALKAALKSLPKGHYIRDTDIRKECHASDTGLWRDVRAQKEFWPYAMVVGNHTSPLIYWGHSESVASLVERGKAKLPNWVRE